MACIKTVSIELIRGTTYTRALYLENPDGTERALADGEILRFGVKATPEDNEYLILKEYTVADYDESGHCYYLTLLPSDTEVLNLDTYVYDIGLQAGPDSYYNLLPLSTFVVSSNVTRRAI